MLLRQTLPEPGRLIRARARVSPKESSTPRAFPGLSHKEITVEEKIQGGGGPPAGAPGAGGPPGGGPGGGRGGMMGAMGPRSYNLDGSETTGEAGRGKFARKAMLSRGGRTLELVNKNMFTGQDGNEITVTSTDKLSL